MEKMKLLLVRSSHSTVNGATGDPSDGQVEKWQKQTPAANLVYVKGRFQVLEWAVSNFHTGN
ncbi:hypothetical protein KIN20_034562 [Parelaphostrongylus tenuis]|uniref:Uncharacterized protein n=1 Tax=Parelaphostrongylus tenuis TaxID=148309 RepID=A0AAD5WJ30_PARTN|nr:hypothetical protein KIN20_034562 [Parelaphostrongylus tenuis]